MLFKRPHVTDIGVQPPAPTLNPSRKSDRLAPVGVSTSIGDVVDLSAAGVRLKLHSAPPAAHSRVCITIDIDSTIYATTVELIWSRMCGFFKFEAGFVFVEPSPELTDALHHLTAKPQITLINKAA